MIHQHFQRHEKIYKNIEIKILIDNTWSFDKENRNKYDKGNIKTYNNNSYVKEARDYVIKHFNDNFYYPITFEEVSISMKQRSELFINGKNFFVIHIKKSKYIYEYIINLYINKNNDKDIYNITDAIIFK